MLVLLVITALRQLLLKLPVLRITTVKPIVFSHLHVLQAKNLPLVPLQSLLVLQLLLTDGFRFQEEKLQMPMLARFKLAIQMTRPEPHQLFQLTQSFVPKGIYVIMELQFCAQMDSTAAKQIKELQRDPV
jgi:hypothetical protein